MVISFIFDDGGRPGQVAHRVKDRFSGRKAAGGGADFLAQALRDRG
jgi:hypothetical protein